MSKEVGRVQGAEHPITVSISRGGVELAIWDAEEKGALGDVMDAGRARALSALLSRAADMHARHAELARGENASVDPSIGFVFNPEDQALLHNIASKVNEIRRGGMQVPDVVLVHVKALKTLDGHELQTFRGMVIVRSSMVATGSAALGTTQLADALKPREG
jgi:hypothetical protein